MGYQEARRHVRRPSSIELYSKVKTKILISPHSSDADSDVLADYVLALIRADSSEPELRKSAVDNLEDFLKESMENIVSRT